MSKTAPQIEAEIRSALNKVRGPARGLYHEMRYLAENLCDGRPGDIRQAGAPMALDTIAQLTGYSTAKVPLLLDKLSAPDVSLVGRHGDGAWHLPHVHRIEAANEQNRRNVAASRAKSKSGKADLPIGVLRKTKEGLTSGGCNGDVIERVPPDGFPPHPPSLSPSPSSLGDSPKTAGVVDNGSRSVVAGQAVAEPDPGSGDELDSRIKGLYATATWIGIWDRATHAKFRSLAMLVPWERAVELVREGIQAGKGYPVGWALGKARSLASESGVKPRARPPNPPASKRPTVTTFGET